MNFESCGVLPRVLNDLAAAKTEIATSGAVIFEPIDCTEAGTRAFAQELFMPDIACLRVCFQTRVRVYFRVLCVDSETTL